MFKIIDNFLDKEIFLKLQYEILSSRFFAWYFQDFKDFKEVAHVDKITKHDLNQYQFTHLFYEKYRPCSESFYLIEPLLNKLKVKSLIRIKANLIPYSPKFYEGYFHTDTDHKSLTAIYYFNTNNGYTSFEKNNKKVGCQENRIVIFDSQMKHTGTNTTNKKKRVVLNINYF